MIRLVLMFLLLGAALFSRAEAVALNLTKFRGAWEAGVSYGQGHVVARKGASYVSLRNKNLNHAPDSSPDHWAVLAVAGTDGRNGLDGKDGEDGKDGAKGDPGASFNPLRIAAKRWYGASQTGIAYPVGDGPVAGAFDGAFLWIANRASASVTKLRPSDGSIQATYSLNGAKPRDILFDGGSLWIATDSAVLQMSVADGSLARSVAAGTAPVALAFDGDSVWVASSDGAYKVKASTGAVGGPFRAGGRPTGIGFDGTHVWVASGPDSTFTKLATTGAEVEAIHWSGGNPQSMAFDGVAMWVLKSDPEGQVTQVGVSDSKTLGNYPVGSNPTGVAFDGAHVWVCSPEGHTVTKLNSTDGSVAATYALDPATTSPYGLVFDGAYIWVLNRDNDTVTKL